MTKRSRAFQKALKLSGGYTPGKGVPSLPRGYTPRLPRYYSPINGRPATQPVPKGSFTRDHIGRVGSAIKTEFFGRANQALRFAKKGFEDAVKANIRPKITLKMSSRMSTTRKPKTKVETVPQLDNEKSTPVIINGRPRFDKVTTKTTMKMDMSGPVKQRSFTTTFRLGKPTSKSILNASKLNGSKTVQLFSTQTDADLKDPTKEHKEYCEIVTGFNQKIFYTSQHLAPRWNQIYTDIYKVTLDGTADAAFPNPDNFNKSNYLNLYGCAKYVNSRITLRNNMNTTSAIVKVHLIQLKDSQADTHLWYKPLATLTDQAATTQPLDTQRIIKMAADYPRPYVRSSGTYNATTNPIVFKEDITNTHAYYCLTVPSVSPEESQTFNDKFTITKTFVKTLDVGDDWTLNIQRTLGAGLRLDEALRAYNSFNLGSMNSKENPFGHRIVIEVCGKKLTAEASKTDTYTGTSGSIPAQADITGQDKFIGTAPCSVSWEASHNISYVLQSYSGLPTSLNETNFDSRVGGPLIRAFVNDMTTTSVPYNVDYWKTNGGSTYISPLTIKSATTATVETVTTTS